MIFVTVGAQMPFDRLVRAVDEWAGARRREDVFAQIGPGSLVPRHLRWERFMEPDAFRRTVESARLIVAHAGMGSILTALQAGKPILVMPRRGDLNETRNDHQVATARRLVEQQRVAAAFDEHQLMQELDRLEQLAAPPAIGPHASPELLAAIRGFLLAEAPR